MKSLFIYFTFLFSSPDKEVITFRDMLHQSFYSSQVAEHYYSKTKHITNSSPAILKGYKAMAEFIMCKHTYNPFSKLIYFNRGKKELDAAIKIESENVELLFLRFATQCNAPSFLGYNTHIASDKIKLFNYVVSETSKEDKDLRTKIATFLSKSKHCNAAEKKQMKLLIN
jgi:hypothetical protein